MKMKTWMIVFSLVLTPLLGQAQNKGKVTAVVGQPQEMLNFKLNFLYKDFPLKIRIFDPVDARKVTAGRVHSMNSLARVPTGNEYKDGLFSASKGDVRKFILVIENPTEKSQYFFMAPHRVNPLQSSLGHRFTCVCNGDIYHVEPKSVWYTVIAVNIEDSAKSEGIAITHKVIGVNPLDVQRNLDEEARSLGGSSL